MTGAEGDPGFPAAPARLRLLPLAPESPDRRLVEWLASELGRRLRLPARVEEAAPAAPEWWTEERSQLSSNRIIDTLAERYPLPAGAESGEWVLAVTAADLQGGGREYVFGEAALGGGWAVIGTARLGAAGEPAFRPRLLKEALHELGHLAGLPHCPDPRCLMAASADVAAVDAKGTELCDTCRSHPQGGT